MSFGSAPAIFSQVALAQITSAQFNVLISDLNIGQPGDGFTVVSAMRRTQPKCITLILTGYPRFETALEAIRRQVDDYLIKPASVADLVSTIEEKLRERTPGTISTTKRIAEILRDNKFKITQRALNEMKSDPVLGKLPLGILAPRPAVRGVGNCSGNRQLKNSDLHL